jgi:demethylmenaquinone methyltransferase/2-methoxy-6-polyprenyl-1,4-benzoquinol methylase
MFSGIARRYDLLNHLLSGNVDKRWRRKVARALESSLVEGARVLDVACGTGDLSLVLAEAGAVRVIGLDFCRPMLEIARRKADADSRSIPFVEGDALRLPFADETFDAVTIAFGLRNLAGVADGLRELRRVLKPKAGVWPCSNFRARRTGLSRAVPLLLHARAAAHRRFRERLAGRVRVSAGLRVEVS